MPSTTRPPNGDRSLETQVQGTLLRLNAQAWGIAFGLTLGLGLFLSTVVLVIRGGEVVGPHLALLGLFLPGYSVTFTGGVIGFVYLFVIGYAIGRLVGELYNRLARKAG
ncbi:MAG: hypothetical protein WD960_00885 [Gemmatimonadota bacterium]